MHTSLFTKVLADRPFEEVIDLTAELGFDAIEPRGRAPHLPVETPHEHVVEYHTQLAERDLDVACLATYTGGYVDGTDADRKAELEDLRRYCEMANTLECDLVRHNPGGPAEYQASDADYEMAATWMRRAADVAADYDVRLAMEIHHGSLIESASGTRAFLDRIDRDNVGAIHDAGNMYIADVDYGAESIRELGEYLFHVHCKGERRVEDATKHSTFELETRHGMETFQHTLLENGSNDHEPAVRALADAGYDGYVSVECHRDTDEDFADVDIASHELEQIRALLGSD